MKALLSIFFIVSAVLTAHTAIAKEIPLQHFVQHGDYLDVELSPDGKHVLARMRTKGKVAIVVINLESKKAVGGVRSPTNDIVHSGRWVSNDRFVYEFAEKFHYNDSPVPTGELFATNIDGSRNTILYGFRAGDAKTGTRLTKRDDIKASQELVSVLQDDEDYILILEHPWSKEGRYLVDARKTRPILSKLNVFNGRKRKVEVIEHPGARLFATPKGEVRFMRWMDKQGYYHAAHRDSNDSEWKPLGETFSELDGLVPIGISDDANKVYLGGRTGDAELFTLFSFDNQTKELVSLFPDITSDIENYILDSKTNKPVVGITYTGKYEYHYADKKNPTAKAHKMLANAFKGNIVDIASVDKSGEWALVHVSSDVNPGEYYLFNLKTKGASFFSANLSWLDPRTMQSMKPIEVQTSDGLTLRGYITLPATEGDTKPPLVVMPHGGPPARDFWAFNRETQLLANRGYAVLQINFRGSDGYGSEFIRKGHREWGGKMIDDIIEATQWTIDEELVDKDRICLFGASYGGYAALMSAVKAPDMYKCTVGYIGVYDLQDMYDESDIPNNWGGPAYLKRALGNDKEQLAAYSPVNHVDKIKAKVMLIHGAKDKRTPEISAEKLAEELTKVGKTPKYLRFSQSGHGVYSEKDQLELYQGLLDFLEENIGEK